MAGTGLLLLVIGIGTFILVYGMRLKARLNERRANLYEKALEQGLDPAELKLELDQRELGDPYGNLKAGIILLAVALAIFLGIWSAQALSGPFRLLGFALVPLMVGVATLFIHFAVPRTHTTSRQRPGSEDESQ
jgi:hypothetical protein